MPATAPSMHPGATDWPSGEAPAVDSRVAGESLFEDREASGGASVGSLPGHDDTARQRIHRTYGAARAVVGVALVAAQGATSVLGGRSSTLLTTICVVYAVQAITVWLLPRFRLLAEAQVDPGRLRRQWMATIGVDLLAFAALHVAESGSSINFAALLVLPVLMAGVLMPRLLALGTASAVAMLLLAVAWRAPAAGGDAAVQLAQAGLAGIGLFLITLLAGELAARLVREELAARGSLQLARQQAQLNRLVIEEMADGVLVIDDRLRVRAANPAARLLLVAQGLAPAVPFELESRAGWAALARAVRQALPDGDWPEAGREITLRFDGGTTRTLRVRMRFMRRRPGTATTRPLAVLLLEDVRTAQARLRQEKLAAMGRVSAGVAHEIRNPLAAIAQANALLLEEPLPPAQAQLARIVADNVERLRRIVDDVMEVAPGQTPEPQPLDAAAHVAAAVADWARTAGIRPGAASRLRLDLPERPLPVRFDAHHLQRVLVNLLDNAARHASATPGAILLTLSARDAGYATLAVLSDGEPLPPEVEQHLFEPFFSTRSRGTGLGLYICRELCERYGASIEYRQRPGAERLRNEFRVVMRRTDAEPPPATAAEPAFGRAKA